MPSNTLLHHHAGDILAHMVSRRLFLAGVTLVLAFAVLLATHYWLLRQEFNAGIAAKVQITASRLIEATRSNDTVAASELLLSLRDFPVITGASLFTADGQRIAQYSKDASGNSPSL